MTHVGEMMLRDADGRFAEDRIAAIVDFLVTVGYIDGVFAPGEQTFVDQYIESLLVRIVDAGSAADDPGSRQRLRQRYQLHFSAVREQVTAEILEIGHEITHRHAPGYLYNRLKVRALEIFKSFPLEHREMLLLITNSLIHADQQVTPEEHWIHAELKALTAEAPRAPVVPLTRPTHPLTLTQPVWQTAPGTTHPLLDAMEMGYSPHPVELQSQLERDYALIGQAIAIWTEQRARGQNRLAGAATVDVVPPGPLFLDQYVYGLQPDPARTLDVIVLGDLHGCYSCLKAALLQSDFFSRVWAFQREPWNYPDVKLVFLGDYIDRGHFSFDGVLRTALQLLAMMPEHVIMLRGNHEHFLRAGDKIFSAVQPAEAITTLASHAPLEMIEAYRLLFEAMPAACFCDQTLLVHGGVPRDDMMETRVTGLASLNDPELRFQMRWSDPVQIDRVPLKLQQANPRFNFGRDQFRRFMEKLGFHTMIRGHERIDHGLEAFYQLGDLLLLTLFSAGGWDNRDLPMGSSYRKVTPMAMTIRCEKGQQVATPWGIDYQTFNSDVWNGFHRPLPVLEYKSG